MSDKLEELKKQQEEIERKIKIEELIQQKETIQKEIDGLAIATTAEALTNATPINIKQQTYNGKVITLKDYRYYINDLNKHFSNIDEAKKYIDSNSMNSGNANEKFSTQSNYKSNVTSSASSSHNKKFLVFIAVLGVVSVLAYQQGVFSSPRQDNINNNKPSNPQKISVKREMVKGFEYSYFNDGSCNESQNKKCLNFQKYKEMCLESQGLTEMAAKSLTIFDNIGRNLAFNGGDMENIRVYWSNSKNNCRGTITLSGIFKGTSYRSKFDGTVTTFIINNQQELLASSIDPIH